MVEKECINCESLKVHSSTLFPLNPVVKGTCKKYKEITIIKEACELFELGKEAVEHFKKKNTNENKNLTKKYLQPCEMKDVHELLKPIVNFFDAQESQGGVYVIDQKGWLCYVSYGEPNRLFNFKKINEILKAHELTELGKKEEEKKEQKKIFVGFFRCGCDSPLLKADTKYFYCGNCNFKVSNKVEKVVIGELELKGSKTPQRIIDLE